MITFCFGDHKLISPCVQVTKRYNGSVNWSVSWLRNHPNILRIVDAGSWRNCLLASRQLLINFRSQFTMWWLPQHRIDQGQSSYATVPLRSAERCEEHDSLLAGEADIQWFQQQEEKRRVKRDASRQRIYKIYRALHQKILLKILPKVLASGISRFPFKTTSRWMQEKKNTKQCLVNMS